jgi:hypothetical protein
MSVTHVRVLRLDGPQEYLPVIAGRHHVDPLGPREHVSQRLPHEVAVVREHDTDRSPSIASLSATALRLPYGLRLP